MTLEFWNVTIVHCKDVFEDIFGKYRKRYLPKDILHLVSEVIDFQDSKFLIS